MISTLTQWRVSGVAVALLILSALSHAEQSKQTVLLSKLENRLREIALRVDGVMGYCVLDLTSGERLGRLENEVFPTASSIKITILYELFKEADEGRVHLDQPQKLDPASRVGGSGILSELTAPLLSLRDLAVLMVVLSDNTATNVLIDTLGLEAIGRRLEALGFAETKLRRRMMDAAAASRGDENVSTPLELVRFLELLNQGIGLTPASRDAALAILKKPKSSPLVDGLPPGVEAASKPGSLEGVRVDAGIVYAQNRPYIFAVMQAYLQNEDAGAAAIRAASTAVYEYFSRLGRSSPYGRRLGY